MACERGRSYLTVAGAPGYHRSGDSTMLDAPDVVGDGLAAISERSGKHAPARCVAPRAAAHPACPWASRRS
ncbi:unnamed protein product [Urochloa humidicola]